MNRADAARGAVGAALEAAELSIMDGRLTSLTIRQAMWSAQAILDAINSPRVTKESHQLAFVAAMASIILNSPPSFVNSLPFKRRDAVLNLMGTAAIHLPAQTLPQDHSDAIISYSVGGLLGGNDISVFAGVVARCAHYGFTRDEFSRKWLARYVEKSGSESCGAHIRMHKLAAKILREGEDSAKKPKGKKASGKKVNSK